MKTATKTLLLFVCVISTCIPAAANPGDLLFDLQKPNHRAYDYFGITMTAVGNNVLVGAPYDSTAGQYAGAAYLYDGSTGALLQTFLNPTPTIRSGVYEYFGGDAVAAVDDRVLIGDTGDHKTYLNEGSVYMFDVASGGLLRTFHNPKPATAEGELDNFGQSISAVGNHVLVGAPFDSDETSPGHAGAAYLFDASTGDLIHTFVSPEPTAYAKFGFSVTEIGDKIIIGEPSYSPTGLTGTGRVHVYDASTFEPIRTWDNPGGPPNEYYGYSIYDHFGRSLAHAGDDLLVSSGSSVLKYDLESGDMLLEFGRDISRGDPESGVEFGLVEGSVAAIGDDILVGARYDYHEGSNTGRLYLFDGESGDLKKTILNPTPDDWEYFGWQVAALDNGNIVATAPNDDTLGTVAGKTYVFEGVPEPRASALLILAGLSLLRRRSRGIGRRSTPRTLVLACLAVATAMTVPAISQAAPGDLRFEFTKPNHARGDRFGRSMASYGEDVLISAPCDDTAGNGAGAVYLYDVTGSLLQTYYNPTPYSGSAGSEYFGVSMARLGNRVLVSDPYDSSVVENGGAVYMFDAATSQLQQTFLNPNGAGGEYLEDIEEFGSKNSVSSIGTDGVLIGAWNSNNDLGSAYLFSAITGDLLHTFTPPFEQQFSRFGYAMLGVDDKIAVSQPCYDMPSAANAAGAVHIFDANTYDLLYTLYDPTPYSNNGQFGCSLAASGDRLIIGGGGGASVFDLNTTGLLMEVSADGTSRANVAAVGIDVLVGGKYYDTDEENVGRAYLFDGQTGEALLTIDNPDPDRYEYFGEAVAAIGTNIVVGADYDDTLGTHSGKAYLFSGVVPEPTTALLLLFGGISLLTGRQRN